MANDYDRVTKLSAGTFGNSWLVNCKASQSRCVLKEISVGDMTQSDIQLTLTDLALITTCKHDNLIIYLDVFVDDGNFVIVSTYADDGNLRERIAEQASIPFPESVILNWFIQISMGLMYLHKRNLVHGDLKPRNVLFSSEHVLELSDYAITNRFPDRCDHSKTFYLSPEICKKEAYEYKSDVWSLGCILYELCCLRMPFHAPDIASLLTAQEAGNFDHIPRHYGLLLQDLVAVMLRPQADTRPNVEQILAVHDLQPHILAYRRHDMVRGVKRQRELSSSEPCVNTKKGKLPEIIKPSDEHNSLDRNYQPYMDIHVDHNMKITSKQVVDSDLDMVVAKAEEKGEKEHGCLTPEKKREEQSSKTTPEDHGPVECYSVESPKKLRMTVTPLMKDRVKKQRAAFSCEKGMKLNVGCPGLGTAPVLNLYQPFNSVRRISKRPNGIKPMMSIKPMPLMSPSDLMNDSGFSDHDLSGVAMESTNTPHGTPAVSTPFRVPMDRPRLSVPVLDMREENVINVQNVRILYLAMLESDTCAARATSTLTFYLQKKLGCTVFENLFDLFKEAMHTQMDFDLLKGCMNKNIMYLPLFAELLKLEHQRSAMQDSN